MTVTLAQTPAPRPPSQTELIPVLVDAGDEGEVVLSIDIDGNGVVTQIRPVSGPANLYGKAGKVGRMFKHKQAANISGATEHIIFRKGRGTRTGPEPVYPLVAKAAHVSGTVELVIAMDAEGKVLGTMDAAGPPMLVGSAKEAVEHSTYPPVIVNGSAKASYAVVDISYNLIESRPLR